MVTNSVPILLCPSDALPRLSYTPSDWNNNLSSSFTPVNKTVLQLVSYQGNHGTSGNNGFENGTFTYGQRTSFADITDGLTNTFMFSENANCLRQDNYENSTPWSSFSPFFSLMYINFTKNLAIDNSCRYQAEHLTVSSLHSGGANFCMADGSVRFIAQNIDSWDISCIDLWAMGVGDPVPPRLPRIYQWLSTRNGSETVPNDF